MSADQPEIPVLEGQITIDEVLPPKRVQRRRVKGWRMPPNTIYVGRGSKWGNPYPVGSMVPTDGETWAVLNASTAAHLFRLHLGDMPVAELAGKNLACWCPLDKPCHADVLLEIANGA